MPSCCGWLVKRTLRQGEPPEEEGLKRALMGPFFFITVLCYGYYIYHGLVYPQVWIDTHAVGLFVIGSSMGSTVAYAAARKALPLSFASSALCTTAVGILLIDWKTGGIVGYPRAYTLNILRPTHRIGRDVLLLANADECYTRLVVCLTLVWCVVSASEEGLRWGLWRIEGWSKPRRYRPYLPDAVLPYNTDDTGVDDAFFHNLKRLRAPELGGGTPLGAAYGEQAP
eukprot:gene22638-15310_t